MADYTKAKRLMKETIEYQAWAKKTREQNKLIKLNLIPGNITHFFDRSGDMIEELVKICFPGLTKLNHKHSSGFDFQVELCSYLEIKGNRASENNGNIFLELTQNKRTGSKSNLMSTKLHPGYDYHFMTIDTTAKHFGDFVVMDWKKAQPDYQKLSANTNGGHNAYGVTVMPIHIKAKGNIMQLIKEKS